SSRRRHTRSTRDWSSDVCSSDLCHSSSRRRCTQLASPAWATAFSHSTLQMAHISLTAPATSLTFPRCRQGNRRVMFSHSDQIKRSEEHTSELQSRVELVCSLLLE